MSSPSSSTARSSLSSQVPEHLSLNPDVKTNSPPTASRGKWAHTTNHIGELDTAIQNVSDVRQDTESNRRRQKRRKPGNFLLKNLMSTSKPKENNASLREGHDVKRENVRNIGISSGSTRQNSSDIQNTSTIIKSPLSRRIPSSSHESLKETSENTEDRPNLYLDERHVTHRWTSGSANVDNAPAQIVNLALNLSETRRRHFGTGRAPSLEAGPNRRIASTPQLAPGVLATTSTGGISNHLNQLRRASKTQSSKPDSSASYRKSTLLGSPFVAGTLQGQLLEDIASGNLVDPSFNPSDATIIRAERAKLTLELAYLHRRLLQYLPALPQCSECKPVSSRLGANSTLGSSGPLGRIFNPLQYIRNRKVRFRERRTLDSEAEGWKDVENVREWVNLVAKAREDDVSKIDDDYPLPKFAGRENVVDECPSEPMSADTTSPSPQAKKAARPRTDWITTPWDLLGDQYWLNQSGNKSFVEDRHRHKLYTGKSSSIPTQPFSRRSGSIPRPKKASERGASSKDMKRDNSHEQDRPRHQRYDSFHSLNDHNSSREIKNRWPRKFIRSYSSSSSEDTDIELKARRRGQNAQTLKDNRLLDRQIMMLMSQDMGNWQWKDVNDFDEGNTTDAKSTKLSDPDSAKSSPSKLGKRSSFPRNHKTRGLRVLNEPPPNSQKVQSSAEAIANNKAAIINEIHKVPKNSIKQTSSVDGKGSFSNSISHDGPKFSGKDQGRGSIDNLDFASDSPDSKQKPRQEKETNQHDSTIYHDIKLPLPNVIDDHMKSIKHRPRIKRTKTLGDQRGPDFRLKGLLRGAKLSDIVASPVNKVGELIWRKDPGDHAALENFQFAASNENSETDPIVGVIGSELSRSATDLSKKDSSEKPRYHMDNLPVFKSPFARDADLTRTGAQDHISRQQSAFRQIKSQRFEKLAPPALDLRSVSRSSSPPEIVKNSTSNSQSPVIESGNAEQRRFAVVEGSPDRQGRRHPVTGNPPRSPRGQYLDENGFLKLYLEPSKGKISHLDIARSTALIRSTNIKANSILRTATSARNPPHPILQDLQSGSASPISSVPRAQEFVLMGGLLIKNIDEKNAALRAASDSFTDTTMSGYYSRLKKLDDFITNELTGMVRKAADDADDLGAQLAADCTMEVKRLNENIDLVLRRRRRRMRWLRRGGYLVLEWTLLTLMWWVWLLVVLFKMMRGTVRAGIKCIKWLLWL